MRKITPLILENENIKSNFSYTLATNFHQHCIEDDIDETQHNHSLSISKNIRMIDKKTDIYDGINDLNNEITATNKQKNCYHISEIEEKEETQFKIFPNSWFRNKSNQISTEIVNDKVGKQVSKGHVDVKKVNTISDEMNEKDHLTQQFLNSRIFSGMVDFIGFNGSHKSRNVVNSNKTKTERKRNNIKKQSVIDENMMNIGTSNSTTKKDRRKPKIQKKSKIACI